MTKDKLLEIAKARFKLSYEADAQQRQREKDDLRFQVPEEQWDPQARQAREGGVVTLGNGQQLTTLARPCLSIPLLDGPIQIVKNQERQAKLGVNIHPVSPEANVETAEVLQGIYRAIERDSRANIARSWSFDRSILAGRGAYEVVTEYEDEGGDPFDQVIRIKRILQQENVYFDPAAQEPDFSDGEYAFRTYWLDKDTFKRQFPKADLEPLDNPAWIDANSEEPDWVRVDGDQKAYLVAKYYYKEHTPQKVSRPGPDGTLLERTMDVVSVKGAYLSGFEVMEEFEWVGRFIPLIPGIGRELQPYDRQRRWVGIIGPNKDAQRTFNYAASNAVELVALEPRAPWVMAEGQDEGYEDEWQQSNTRNLPALRYKMVSLGDKPAPPPARVQIDVSRLGPSMALLQQASGWAQTGTQLYDPSLGRTNQHEQSGKAILALQQQGDVGNSGFLMNQADITMTYEAKVILDAIPKVYDRPGRIARTLDIDDTSEEIMLNQPFVKDPQTGRPMAAPPPDQRGDMQVKEYNLQKGVYSVSVSIGKSYQSQLQQGAEEIGEMLTARPELMPLIGPEYMHFRDFPYARKIAKILKKVRDKQFPGVDEPDPGSPEEIQAQLAQMQQENEQLKQQVEQMGQALETEQVKQQATIQKAGIDAQSKVQVAQIDQQTQLMLADLKQRMAALETQIKVGGEREKASAKVQGDLAKEVVKGQFELEKADLAYKGAAEQALTGERDQI